MKPGLGFEREGVGKREFPLAENTTLGSEAKSKMEFGFLPSEPIEKEKLSLNRGVLGSDPPAGGERREIPGRSTWDQKTVMVVCAPQSNLE